MEANQAQASGFIPQTLALPARSAGAAAPSRGAAASTPAGCRGRASGQGQGRVGRGSPDGGVVVGQQLQVLESLEVFDILLLIKYIQTVCRNMRLRQLGKKTGLWT